MHNTEVKLTVLVDSDTIFNQIANYTDIAPDLQYIENVSLSKGTHVVKVIAAAENEEYLTKTDTINFDGDKWVFISYQYEAPPDSAEREAFRRANKDMLLIDPTFMNDIRKGRKAELIIHIMHQEPVHH